MSNTKHSTVRGVITFIISGVVILCAVWLILNRQFALDTVSTWSYRPSSEIEAIAEKTQLTQKARFTFYATHPEVLSGDDFNRQCPRSELVNPILGCYTGSDRIYIYNVTDAQLNGMKEVTAAHEVLHAVWQRMSKTEQETLARKLTEVYTQLNDTQLKERMAYYQRAEPGEFTNELHSILGTEVPNLGDELESYYAQYFDRKEVLALHDGYSQLYTQLTTTLTSLRAEMESLGKQIDTQSQQYTTTAAQLSTDIDTFNSRANGQGFTTVAQFTTERAALIVRSQQIEADRQSINTLIARYNTLHEEYGKLSEKLKGINDSMDSYKTLDTTPAL